MQMYSCGKYWFLDSPELVEVDVAKIAASLAKLARWNGHSTRFISVAEHSINVARLLLHATPTASPFAALVGLLHDAHEAYIGDWPEPLRKAIKIEFQGCLIPFEQYEKIMQRCVLDKLLPGGFTDEVESLLKNEVNQRDVVIRTHEMPDLYGGKVWSHDGKGCVVCPYHYDEIEGANAFIGWVDYLKNLLAMEEGSGPVDKSTNTGLAEAEQTVDSDTQNSKLKTQNSKLIMHKNNPLDTQVGGNHYKRFAIQPVEYNQKNGIGYCEGNVIKYVTRHRFKNGRQDLDKAIHYLEVLKELEYGEDAKNYPGEDRVADSAQAPLAEREVSLGSEVSPGEEAPGVGDAGGSVGTSAGEAVASRDAAGDILSQDTPEPRPGQRERVAEIVHRWRRRFGADRG